jgi:hypothetical protein
VESSRPEKNKMSLALCGEGLGVLARIIATYRIRQIKKVALIKRLGLNRAALWRLFKQSRVNRNKAS